MEKYLSVSMSKDDAVELNAAQAEFSKASRLLLKWEWDRLKSNLEPV